MKHTTRWFGIVLTMSTLARAVAAEPSQVAESDPPIQHTFSDDFQTDTRAQYAISGPVGWQKGQLILGKGAVIRRRIAPGQIVHLVLDLTWPAVTERDSNTNGEICFVLEGGKRLSVAIDRRVVGGKTHAAVRFIEQTNSKTREIRRLPLAAAVFRRPIESGFGHGLLIVGGEDDPDAIGYGGSAILCCEAIELRCTLGTLGCRKIELSSTALSAQQQRDLREAELPKEVYRLWWAGKYRETLPLALRAVQIRHRILGQDHPDYALSLNDLAGLYKAMRECAKAEPLYLQALEIRNKVLGKDHPDYAASLHNLALLYIDMGERAKAEPLLVRARDIWKEALGEDHPNYAHSLNSLAVLYQAVGEYAKAEPLFLQALEIRKKVLGEEHPHYAATLNNLVSVYYRKREYAKAVPFCLQARDICKKVLGEEHPDTALSIFNLAAQYEGMGEYAKAEPLYLEALEIRKKALGEDHPDYADSLNNLATLNYRMGEYAKAELLCLQALEIRKRVLGEDHRTYAASLNNLGVLYEATGDYTKAEPPYLRALQIWKKVFGEDHPDYAGGLNNLAWLYYQMGEYAKAESLYLQALYIKKKVLGEGHPDYATSLNNLAQLYYAKREYARAETLYLQALQIWRKVLGEDNRSYAFSVNNLAALYHSMGQYSKAEPLCMQARDIWKKVLGEDHPLYCTSLNNLAQLYYAMGEYAKAEPLCMQALHICEKVLGEDHPHYAAALTNLGVLYSATRQYDRAVGLFERAAAVELRMAEAVFAAVSEAQALNFAAIQLGPPGGLLSAWRHAKRSDGGLYSTVWMRRALIQRVVAGRQRLVLDAQAPHVRQLYAQYLQTRRAVARLILAPADPDPKRMATSRQRLTKLSEDKERLERQLANELPEFRRQLEAGRRPHSDLTQLLPEDTVYVDLLRYSLLEQAPAVPGKAGEKWTPSYVAFVLGRDRPVVRVELGPARPIDQAVEQWSDAIKRGLTSRAANDLRRLLWEPLAEHLSTGTKTVYLCPDGPLCRVSWAALPGRKRGTVLLEDYALAVVPYGQFLLEQLGSPRSATPEGGLLAIGGVSYDDRPQAAPRHELLALRSAALAPGRLRWLPLPETEQELSAVMELSGDRPVKQLRGSDASTSRVLAELPRARWAHFATHGFFADPKFRSALQLDERAFERQQFLFGGERTTVAGRNPLVLSGLVLAGANLPRPKDDVGVPQGDGGILTAEAIAGLPLDNLELAVLSACETGLGDVAGGEGVFGLQRAFHLAGARNVIASLWKVDDAATAALMRLFYHKLWQENKPPIVALREAQLAVYRHPEQIPKIAATRGPDFTKTVQLVEGGRPGPRQKTAPTKLWAAFVISGAGR